jgi:hypothetical protein
MTSARLRLPLACCIGLMLAAACASTQSDVRVWRAGSPHRGDAPRQPIPPAARIGLEARLQVESYPARDFIANLDEALDAGVLPDILVINNYGVIDGITTRLGRFDGIGQDPAIRKQLVMVKGSFDALLGPERGWTFLLSRSENFAAARAAALRRPECGGPLQVHLPEELASAVPDVVAAYMRGDERLLDRYGDPERVAAFQPNPEPARVREVRTCATWGSERFVIVSTKASYEADTSIGHVPVLLVFRKPAARWQLLAASRDPVTNGRFLDALSRLSFAGEYGSAANAVSPVILRSPANGVYPSPVQGARFGEFVWDAPVSDDVVADVAEFAYNNDVRLFVVRRNVRGVSRVSSGSLWSTKSEWKWRIWSVMRGGAVVFSETRRFPN